MPFITPETLPSQFKCRRVSIPDDVDWLSIVNGALVVLTRDYNFERIGITSLTPEETAEVFQDMFFKYLNGEPCLIGSVQLYATQDAPYGTLICDGSTHLRVDYPQLYEVLDAQYIVDADHFVTPNPVSFIGLNWYIVAK